MKKAILIVLTLFAALPALPAEAEPGPLTLLLTGSNANDSFRVSLSPDGRQYQIFSAAPLEAGGDICSHPEERPNELSCEAPAISGFEVNAGGGSDFVDFSSDIPVPVTVRGGAGSDHVLGGASSDKLLGGPDHDVLIGRRGDDWLAGGPGDDGLVGGQGNDQLRGGPGEDKLVGGPGNNTLIQ
jgi:Ca2+-binding RTX toxin-like protein